MIIYKNNQSNLAFFQGGAGKIYCYANFYGYAIVFGPNFRRGQSLQGGKLPQGAPPCGRSQLIGATLITFTGHMDLR